MQHHTNECAFDPNVEVICDKGCNVKMTRLEYLMENCVAHTAYRKPISWTICDRMQITGVRAHILTYDGNGTRAIAQTSFSLQPSDGTFKIKVLRIHTGNFIGIGLTPTGNLHGIIPGCRRTIGYYSEGYVFVDRKKPPVGPKWKIGDIVECGVAFPNNDGHTNAEVYFSLNGELTFKKEIQLPIDGVYPTVYMWNDKRINNTVPKIEFLN